MPSKAAVTPQVARAEGIYRWSGRLDYTKFARVGEELPQYPSEPSRKPFTGAARWLLLAKDNMSLQNCMPVFLAFGTVQAIQLDFFPEVGQELNIMAPHAGKPPGLYAITSVDDSFEHGGDTYYRITVEWVGEFRATLPIHVASQMSA